MTRFVLQLRRFGVRLTADRRRFGILCMLMAVALLFWTRLIVIKRIPRTALAETELVIAQDSLSDEHDWLRGSRPAIAAVRAAAGG